MSNWDRLITWTKTVKTWGVGKGTSSHELLPVGEDIKQNSLVGKNIMYEILFASTYKIGYTEFSISFNLPLLSQQHVLLVSFLLALPKPKSLGNFLLVNQVYKKPKRAHPSIDLYYQNLYKKRTYTI